MANKNPMQPEPITPEFNSALITAALVVSEWPRINLRDSDALRRRTREYFELCDRQGMRPSNLGLYAAWGMSKQDVFNAVNGKYKYRVSPESVDFIQKAKAALSLYREQLSLQGKLSPPIAIFWAKNYDGMQDNATLEVATRPTYLEDSLTLTPAEIEERLQKMVPNYNEDPVPEAYPDAVKKIEADHEAEVQRRIAEDIPLDEDWDHE